MIFLFNAATLPSSQAGKRLAAAAIAYLHPNTIEDVNRQIRKVIRTKGFFLSDDAALKPIYLALKNANVSAIMPARDWKQTLRLIHKIFRAPVFPLERYPFRWN